MKFSILGFNQILVTSIVGYKKDAKGKTKELKLDMNDLIIMREIADFMNRKKIIKYTIDDKMFFSIQYQSIIEDLPILGIKQQALADRIDKLVFLKIIEKKIVKTQIGSFTAFRLTDIYEELQYGSTSSQLLLQKYSTTSAHVVDYEPKDNTTNTSITNNNKEDTNVSKKAKTNWRADIEVYRKACDEAKDILADDKECEDNFLRIHPNADYYRSLLKSLEFWKSDKGWETKKKSRVTNINMVSTIKNNLEKNVIYKNVKDAPIQNERLLHIRKIDENGTLADGTVFKMGHRYYRSNKDNQTYSIPVDALERPDERWEFDIRKNQWYLPEEEETIDDLLW